jgi:hypothetical protein
MPNFSQKFTMSDWVTDTTTFHFSFYRNVKSWMDDLDDRLADKFYAVVSTTPDASGSLTDPGVVSTGETSLGKGGYDPKAWTHHVVELDIASGVNLEDYAGEQLYLYLYNDSNTAPLACASGPCLTEFYFDDVGLQTCTTQPLPSTISTRITGKLTLNFSDGSSSSLPKVKVWAYAPSDNAVYETFTIQDGTFNFYNLPATAEGIEYDIFAQYHLRQGTQIETLAANASILLTTANDDNNPAITALDLWTLAPLP